MPIPVPPLPASLETIADGLDEATCLELVAEAYRAFDAEAAMGLASALGLDREAARALIRDLDGSGR